MSTQIPVNKKVTILGKEYNVNTTITADNVHRTEPPSIPAAKVGVLTVRTDSDTGSLTMNGGHGIATGNRLDLYWIDPTDGSQKYRIGMTVGTVAGNVVPIDGGAGDNLPLAAAAITAMVPVFESLIMTGTNAVVLTAFSQYGGVVVWSDAAGTVNHLIVELTTENPAYSWSTADGSANPITGDAVGRVYFSHPWSDKSCTMNADTCEN